MFATAFVGVEEATTISTFQIDRGRFENFMWQRCLDQGIEALRSWRVEQ